MTSRDESLPSQKSHRILPAALAGAAVVLSVAAVSISWRMTSDMAAEKAARMTGHPPEAAPAPSVQETPALEQPTQLNNVHYAAFADQGRRVVSTGSDGLDLWDAATAKRLQHADLVGPGPLAVAPDGRLAVIGLADGHLLFWDVIRWTEARKVLAHQVENCGAAVTGLDFAPDGRLLLSSGLDGYIRLWEANSGRERRKIVSNPSTRHVAFDPTGERFLGVAGNNTVTVYDLDESAKPMRVQSSFQARGPGSIAAFTGQATRLVRTFPAQQTVEILETQPYLQVGSFTDHTGPAISLAVCAPVGWALSGSTDKTVRLWEVDTGNLIRSFEGHSAPVTCVAFAPDGKSAVSVGGEVRLWDLPPLPLVRSRASGPGGSSLYFQQLARRLQGRWLLDGYPGGPAQCYFREDGTFLLSAKRDGHDVAVRGNWKVTGSGGYSVEIRLTTRMPHAELCQAEERLDIHFVEDGQVTFERAMHVISGQPQARESK